MRGPASGPESGHPSGVPHRAQRGSALQELACTAPLPVSVVADLNGRLQTRSRPALYYVPARGCPPNVRGWILGNPRCEAPSLRARSGCRVSLWQHVRRRTDDRSQVHNRLPPPRGRTCTVTTLGKHLGGEDAHDPLCSRDSLSPEHGGQKRVGPRHPEVGKPRGRAVPDQRRRDCLGGPGPLALRDATGGDQRSARGRQPGTGAQVHGASSGAVGGTAPRSGAGPGRSGAVPRSRHPRA
jgi:hypothetical protein